MVGIKRNAVYESKRDALIPIAEKFANRMWGRSANRSKDQDKYDARWSRTFHQKMDKLAKEAGI